METELNEAIEEDFLRKCEKCGKYLLPKDEGTSEEVRCKCNE